MRYGTQQLKVISNSLDITFIHIHIHSYSCKDNDLPVFLLIYTWPGSTHLQKQIDLFWYISIFQQGFWLASGLPPANQEPCFKILVNKHGHDMDMGISLKSRPRVIRGHHYKGHHYNTIIPEHYNDIIMSTMASQITSLMIAYSTIHSRCRSKETSKLGITGLCEGNSPVTSEFPTQRASKAENASIWWHHPVVQRTQ